MESKAYCPIFKWMILTLCLVFLTGCSLFAPAPEQKKPEIKSETLPKESPAPAPAEKPPVSSTPLPPKPKKPAPPPETQQTPKAMAALNFSAQGQAYLKNKKPDEAIRSLERAVNLNPRNGENYYYLAEAWIMKGNADQAGEFNRLAGMYIKADPEWKQKIESQKERIGNLK